MPAVVRKSSSHPSGKKYSIVNRETGKVYGHSTTRAKAEASARMVNAAGRKKGEKL